MSTTAPTPFPATESVELPAPAEVPGEELVGRFRDYAEAQRLVDALSDAGFPVGAARIIGRDVTIVEQVTGRMTKGRATGLGAASGAWFGLFIGLLLAFFSVSGFLSLALVGAVTGAVWGALFGFVGHAATGGRRDFSSVRGLAAGSYDVLVGGGLGARAREIAAAS